ncbi:uncharacterized protein LOC111714850 [Eurytemora carolleeae]|uniref:uncharacterized protein LOC111714850 n=1 Tax=Eurytemora carolleeae TaxID=1294199 RepID=UPI000C787057|nr:uncharacterized protein LOC111714850 [Eurytemora carolleeae]|eukprot:XP_023345828.1 uncharacterized protein LOC111714850 [Eurytemora affinis]
MIDILVLITLLCFQFIPNSASYRREHECRWDTECPPVLRDLNMCARINSKTVAVGKKIPPCEANRINLGGKCLTKQDGLCAMRNFFTRSWKNCSVRRCAQCYTHSDCAIKCERCRKNRCDYVCKETPGLHFTAFNEITIDGQKINVSESISQHFK